MAFSALDLAVANDYSAFSVSSYDRQFIFNEEALLQMELTANVPTPNYNDFDSFIAYFGRSKDLKLKNGRYTLEYDKKFVQPDGKVRYRFYLGENVNGINRYYLVEAEKGQYIKLRLRTL